MKGMSHNMKSIFSFIWKSIDIGRRIIGNVLFIVFVIFVISVLLFNKSEEVPDGSALMLSPSGDIVEQKHYSNPMAALINQAFGDTMKEETLLKDILDAVDEAINDKRIKTIILDLDEMNRAGINKLQDIGESLKHFRNSGKKIIAYGDSYSQNQYFLAAYANEVYLHPHGSVILRGYGVYRIYFKKALEKLLVNFHAFQAGTYKSALEPFIRDDMSEKAKEANMQWLNVLWSAYKSDVEKLRGLETGEIDDYINGLVNHLRKADGDTAKLAVEKQLVDGLKTRDEMRKYLIQVSGRNSKGDDFNKIHFEDYLRIVRSSLNVGEDSPKVGVIVAKGNIMNGEQLTGNIGCDSLTELIRQARDDEKIKAIVLRIDSGGGSSFASEVIRREIELTQSMGKPVVVSMGSFAASGGYWIAATADEIWATSTTITGSIGVFGAITTYDKSLDYLGISNDGVGTTQLSNAFDQTRPLNPLIEDLMQQLVENSYQRFVRLVSDGRNMSLGDVDKIAQGRVWSGKSALKLGLIDKLGRLDAAAASAAKRAGLDTYEIIYVERPLTAGEKFVQQLNEKVYSFSKDITAFLDVSPVSGPYRAVRKDMVQLSQMNDPQAIYARCMTCDVR